MIYWHDFKKGIFLYLLCCIIIVIYMLILYIISHSLMQDKATASLIYDNEGNIRGSKLLAQSLSDDRYFKGRINLVDDNKCDLAMYSEEFRSSINSRYEKSANKSDVTMITSSSSLLDPYILQEEAVRQAKMVADARNADLSLILELIDKFTLHSTYPFFQLNIVNVTALNAELDFRQKTILNSHY